MPTTTNQFKTRFPEFLDEDDDRVQLFLDDAALLMGQAHGEERWLGFFDVAQEYYAGHMLVSASYTADGDAGIVAPIKHQEVDDVVIKSALSDFKPSQDDLFSTSYGKRYAQYRKICFVGIRGT